MFQIDPSPKFWAQAAISVPGQKDPAMIDVQYNHLDADELKVFQTQTIVEKEPIDALMEIINDWKGASEEFNKQSLAKVLKNYPASGRQFYDAYIKELLGVKTKN
ncbi:phage tail assembly chaperone [Undibacterium macrobrachii]|uniref:Uncharacterized protein n=1 Tax=Undibacterium macrobrachii TaxID=1119058 RepID=A0ABQ2X614_9BURK|nr:phage tail assembly chaperone [Undibacterium macrobrachii]GGX01426.1 hypothetical protein GCM10011282_04190 [Undibacterium macrobrachii]